MTPSLLAVLLALSGAPAPGGDGAPLSDPGRPVFAISRDGFDVQWATASPCATKLEVREGTRLDFKGVASYSLVQGDGAGLWHTLHVGGLRAGKRYYYRLYDPGARPDATESAWGAAEPWSREYAVSTEAPSGRKTIVRLPVKVLLMPNVVNVESAVQPDGSIAPEPKALTAAQIALAENEFRLAERVFWVNSGMRLWVDFKFFVDARWQRWGPEAASATPFFQNLPLCRSYGGADYVPPGGGAFTYVDPAHPEQAGSAARADGFPCQVEVAMPRKWDPEAGAWRLYESGGGTLGADDWPRGTPARTQFLGGGDIAWLAEHEVHHQLESLGSFSLADREDDRIVFDHPSPRRRYRRPDGSIEEQAWNTAGAHGEQWDVMRYWDRRVSAAQWLRMAFGETLTVADANGDGFPDDDVRLPLDAKRFKRYAGTASYRAALEWDWTMTPLQPSWVKDRLHYGLWSPNPSGQGGEWRENGRATSGSTGAPIVPRTFGDGLDASAWASVPLAGEIHRDGLDVTYRQAYDAYGFTGYVVAKGPLDRIELDLDGEGRGMFTPPGALGFVIRSTRPEPGAAGPDASAAAVRATFGPGAGSADPKWLSWQASRKGDVLTFFFRIPNGGAGPWFWEGAGHRIGFSLNAYAQDGRGSSMGEPYRLTYAPMLERRGREDRPPAPAAASAGDGVAFDEKPRSIAFVGGGWRRTPTGFEHAGPESMLVGSGVEAKTFDVLAQFDYEGGEFGLRAYAPANGRYEAESGVSAEIDAEGGGSIDGFGQFGERAKTPLALGPHLLQLTRRSGELWLLLDGRPFLFARDDSPELALSKFAFYAGPGSKLVVTGFRIRAGGAPAGDVPASGE